MYPDSKVAFLRQLQPQCNPQATNATICNPLQPVSKIAYVAKRHGCPYGQPCSFFTGSKRTSGLLYFNPPQGGTKLEALVPQDHLSDGAPVKFLCRHIFYSIRRKKTYCESQLSTPPAIRCIHGWRSASVLLPGAENCGSRSAICRYIP